jgi:4-diphosphocytidyl-2-C-methyl-D-erythritol kinase
MRSVTVASPAKINVHLGVHTQLDPRGYHRVDSVMHAVSLEDAVVVSEAPALSVAASVPLDCPPEKNTCWRATQLFCAALGIAPAFSVFVEKNIPSQAGLGGASTNAAATLLGLAALTGTDPHAPFLSEVARSVGADVPFFLEGACAYLDGAGDVLNRLLPPVALHLALVIPPDSGITAAAAYRDFDRAPVAPAPVGPILSAFEARDTASVVALMANNLDPVARRMRPVLDAVHTFLTGRPGVQNVMVTGSGSCTYGVFDTEAQAKAAVSAAAEQGWRAWYASTKQTSCEIVDFCAPRA